MFTRRSQYYRSYEEQPNKIGRICKEILEDTGEHIEIDTGLKMTQNTVVKQNKKRTQGDWSREKRRNKSEKKEFL